MSTRGENFGLIFGSKDPVDARGLRLARTAPMYAAYVGDAAVPHRIFKTWEDADAWLETEEAAAMGDVYVRSWYPKS